MLPYLIIFGFSFIVVLVSIPAIRKLSLRYDFYDDPKKDPLKVHKSPIPFLGGGTILLALLLGLILVWVLKRNNIIALETQKLVAIAIGSMGAWFYGFWDDTQWKQRGQVKQMIKIIGGKFTICDRRLCLTEELY